MMSCAISRGIAPMAATTVYSVEGLAGFGGRLLFGTALGPPVGGWIFDHYGSYEMLYVASGSDCWPC